MILDDYQTLDYLGLVSPMMINKQPVYHKNLGLVTYSPRVLNMPILLSNTSNGRSKFSYHQQHHYDPGRGGTRQSLSSIHYSPNPENTSYQIAHFHSLSQPQSMNSRYTTLPTFSNCSQTVNEINSAFVSDYNQYPNIVTTQNNNSSNDKIGNILLPYQLMATSIINLNSWSYNNRVAKHPTQSNTYYDIRQPDFESNKTTMSKSKSQQLSTNNNFTTIETYLPNNDINEDDCLIESSTTWNDTKTISQTTESINESNNNNNLGSDIGVTHLSKSWNETKKWTTDNITNLPKNLVKVSDQNFQSHNNINNFITIAPTISTATLNSNTTTTNITDKTTVTVPHTNNSVNSSNIVSVIHSSQIGKQKKVNDSGKYMSAALRESSFV
ncbi:unnamed protein product [Heterobilharzia americana]|nr:unnamed protein product [Heterobilharzia americana]